MIILAIFIIISVFSIVRTVCYAVFTARNKNYAGASMLFVLAAVLAAGVVFSVF